ncbi:very short patch repair endonuclease [Amycolatopsis alba DSM 44262]|uniref:Very short patch repair endonuclease n=2 Tax=Amycolatopsis alba TaxID=76020 RepID=A0A229RRQ0_AMYAL|nr:very short patch repair endonuclease [Amycolatopsis alba DSM 44262]
MVDLGASRYARASVDLRLNRTATEVLARLRWSDGGKAHTHELGQVSRSTRARNLSEGWTIARNSGLVTTERLPSGSWASSAGARASMRGNRSRDTEPELALRRLLHRRGLRYRVSARPIVGSRRTADILFPKAKVAVFVDGCFWHGCPEHHRPSSVNSTFWRDKIEQNRKRDADTTAQLNTAGWTVIRAWEHEDPATTADLVEAAVRIRTSRADG